MRGCAVDVGTSVTLNKRVLSVKRAKGGEGVRGVNKKKKEKETAKENH